MGLSNKLLAFLDNNYNKAFLAVLVFGLMLRLKYFFIESIWNDASVHLWYAIKLLRTPTFLFTPQFLGGDYVIPQLITAFYYLFIQNIFIAGKLMALTYASIGIVFIYFAGCALRDKTTGLVAALLFALNPLFWFYSTRPLVDAPLTTMFIIVVYCILKLEKERTSGWAVATAVAIIAAILTKKPAVLFLFSFIIYLAVFHRKEMIREKSFRLCWLLLIGLFVFANSLYYILHNSNIFGEFINKIILHEGLQQGFEALSNIPHLVSWYIIILSIVGFALLVFYKYKKFNFIITSSVIYYLFFEFFVRGALDRYLLPLIPLMILLSAFAIVEISKVARMVIKVKQVKHAVLVLMVLLICFHYYNYGSALIDLKADSYTGYQEAGEWIKENVPEKHAVVFVGSPRSIRAFSEREVYEAYSDDVDGALVNLRSQRYANKYAFENDLNKAISSGRQIYLEIDVWEYAQHDWYYPLTQKSVNYFQTLGFSPIKIVERQIQTSQGEQKVPVILIFKYNL